MTCKFDKKCGFYSLDSTICIRGGSDFCGAYKNQAYGRVKVIAKKEKGITMKHMED
jgi:hypothetical protein